jgi:hypothetical protein
VLTLVILVLMPLAAASQGVPGSPVPGEAPTGVLAEFEIDSLPTPHAEVWFLRMGLAPEGTVPLGRQVGPTVLYVESGQLTLETDGPLTLGDNAVTSAGGTAMPGAASETRLKAGTSVLIADGTSVSATNAAGAPVTFLLLLLFAAEREGEDQDSSVEPVGLTQHGISVGTAEFLPVPATLTIERVVVPAGTMTPDTEPPEGIGSGWRGIELGAVETGSAQVVFESRSFQNLTWPGMTTGGLVEPEAVPLTAMVRLAQGDGYAAFNSTLTWASMSYEPLTVLRAVVTPHRQ